MNRLLSGFNLLFTKPSCNKGRSIEKTKPKPTHKESETTKREVESKKTSKERDVSSFFDDDDDDDDDDYDDDYDEDDDDYDDDYGDEDDDDDASEKTELAEGTDSPWVCNLHC